MTPILPTSEITYLMGGETVLKRPLIPYAAVLCEFLNDLSSELRSCEKAAAYPDVLTFAFWCRKAHIAQLRKNFEDGTVRLGLGLVLHITPSNVPINFAFSFVFGLLSGNANIVRVPFKPFPQIDIICTAMAKLFEDEAYSEIKKMTAFVKYERSDAITAEFSKNCDARVIWGGDDTIRNIRALPMPERGIDIAFSDRYSFCIINAPSVLALDENQLNQLVKNFYNDTYLMDQNACSSPHLIIWQGQGREQARIRFWAALSYIVEKKYLLMDIHAADKYLLLCNDAIELNNMSHFTKHGNFIYRVSMSHLPDQIDKLRGKCGYFYEYDMSAEDKIGRIISGKCQTITYFGIDPFQLRELIIEQRLLGVDRIVPIGKALDIDVIWDGHDVIKKLSRIIDVQ